MKRSAIGTRILTAGGALVVLALAACFYPSAWSPDSKHVVFSVTAGAGDGAIQRLVMTDLEGKRVREMASIKPEDGRLSPAAWSPDGRWIAYFRFEFGEEDGLTWLVSLILQEAHGGDERVILKQKMWDKYEYVWEANAFMAPQWAGDSKRLLIYRMTPDRPGVVLLNLDGKTVAELTFEDEDVHTMAGLAPAGDQVSYAQPAGDDETCEVRVRNIKDGTERKVVELPGHRAGPIAWSADSGALLIATNKKDEEGEKHGAVHLVNVKTGKAQQVWAKENAGVMYATLSHKTGRVAVDYGIDDKIHAVDMVDPDGPTVTPVHFGLGWMGATISPDGQWVALGAPTKDEGSGEAEAGFAGVIVSADGSSVRLFVADEEKQAVAAEAVLVGRLTGALAAVGAVKAFEEVGDVDAAQKVKAAHAILDRIAGEHKSAVFKEAVAFGRAALYERVFDDAAPEEIEKLLPKAREHLAAFRKLYPDHPAAGYVEKQLDRALEE